MKYKVVVILIILILITGCSTEKNENSIFSAASLTESLEEFNESKDNSINIVFDSSTRLRIQIENGGKPDVYLSANKKNIELLNENELISESREILRNKMILITPKESNIKSFEDLGRDIKLIVAAEEVPCGKYAREVIKNHNKIYGENFYNKVLGNIVSEELNVKLVVSKVLLEEGDAGIVYATDVTSENRDNLNIIEIENKYNIEASYWICLVNQNSKKFYDEILNSEKLKKIFANKGFEVVY
jgi:molybdate transport system substrate-binding protein